MDIRQGKSKIVTLVPDAPMVGPTAVIYDSEGEELVGSGDLTATPSTVSTTVAADGDNSRWQFRVEDATGFAPGLTVQVTDPKWGAANSEVSVVESDMVRLVEPLPDEPDEDSTVVGLDVVVAVPAEATAELGVGYVVEVTAGEESVQTDFAVVRYPMQGPCKAQQIREKVGRGFSGELLKDERFYGRAAEKVNDEIRTRLMATGRYASHYWSPKALGPLCDAMITLVLSTKFGLREGGSDRDSYNAAAEADVEARKRDVVASVQLYDKNADGKIDSDEKGIAGRYAVELVQ